MPRAHQSRTSVPVLLGGSFFFLLLWQILLMAQNPGLMSDDSGEMIAASYRLGLPHPPGYPLYCLLGNIFSHLPLGTVAFRFNLLSSLVGLVSLWFVMDTCRRLSAGKMEFQAGSAFLQVFLPLFIGATLFLNRSFFAQAMTAKGLVYMLSLLAISALVWMRTRRELEGPGKRAGYGLYLILFLFVLGFTNHWQTLILLVPFMIVWHFQERNPWPIKNYLISASLGLTALSLYLYLPLRSALNLQPDWGMPSNFSRFMWVVARKLSSSSESPVRGLEHYVTWGGEYARLMGDFWWPGFWLVGIIGAGVLLIRARKLALSFFTLYLVVLYSLLTVARDEVLFLLNVYLLSIHGLFAVFGFIGLAFIFKILMEWRKGPALVAAGFLLFVLAGWGINLFKTEDKSRYSLASDFGMNVLKALPRDALFLAEGDHVLMPAWYERFVNGARPDIVFQPAPFLLHDWGWRQLGDQCPDFKGLTKPGQTFSERLRGLAEGPRPFFYSLDRQYLGVELDKMPGFWEPEGLIFRWGRKQTKAKWISAMTSDGISAQRLRGLSEFWESPGRDVSTTEIYRYYANQHFLIADSLYRQSEDLLAVKHLELGLGFFPEPKAYGNLAVVLAKKGYPEMARHFFQLSKRGVETPEGR